MIFTDYVLSFSIGVICTLIGIKFAIWITKDKTMTKDKIIGTAYVNIIQDQAGQVKFAYGYELDDNAVSLNDLAMLNSFLDKIKDMAKKDFQERLDKNDDIQLK